MAKNKKGKVVSIGQTQMSPEKYVRTQARTLPIFECVINDDWQTSGLCNIIVARQHKTGNVTIGIYLIDMFCLGVKDAQFDFNLYLDEYEDIKSRFSGEVCDYVLAHNIIFGAIAYAEDYGFKPHKDFETARFILEEDDEDVPLIELEFGLNGKPHYVSGPYDDSVKVNNILAILERTAGAGSFSYTSVGGAFGDMNDDDFDNWDDDEWDGEDDELEEDIEYAGADGRLKAMVKVVKCLDEKYDATIRSEQAKEMLATSPLGTEYELSETEGALEDNRFTNGNQEDEYYRLRKRVVNNTDAKLINELKTALIKNAGSPAFYNLLQTAFINNKQYKEAEDTITLMYKLFPDYFPARINYAGMLLKNDELEGFWSVFDSKPDLNYLYPGRSIFNLGEALAYYGTMCRYFITINEMHSADLYMNAMLKYADTDLFKQIDLVKFAVTGLLKMKLDALK